ncbi:MAG: HEAT repeat domain-containing protein [Planctomycetales bacterium]|nr:HEAT repeat domain-containing protein [Planctomycetales bacterium]
MKPHFHHLEYTLQVLASSSNEAAIPVLLAALESDDHRIRDGVFPILLQRRSAAAENEIMSRWPNLSDHFKQLVIRRGDWLSPAVRGALSGDDAHLASLACVAAVELGDFELIPNLVAIVCGKKSAIADQAARSLLTLTERLAEEVSGPRDYRNRKDAQLLRSHVLASLEKGVQNLDQCQPKELIESLLILATRDNAVVSRILQEPTERAFVPMMDLLIHSPRSCVMRLLLSYLDDPFAPLSALQAIGRRRDITWLRQLCRKIGDEPASVARTNLKRIENIPWLKSQQFLFDSLLELEQVGAVRFITLSGVPRQEVLEALSHILRHGKPQGRRAAAEAFAEFASAEANAIMLDALDDEDPLVRVHLAVQLRARGVPGSTSRLVNMLASPHEVERQGARKALEEFTFARYLANFDYLDEESRDRSGQLVRRIDENSASLLREELCAASRTRRRRGLEMALHMGLVTDLQEAIAVLSRDEDQYIRLEAVRLLGNCPTDISRRVLREALSDSQVLVREAAERGLRDLTHEEETDVTPIPRNFFELNPETCNSGTA